MTQYLLDTLLWTGALIALVLILRRPVARHFGPQAAYALWTLPLLRLVVPPITLPAWLKPAEAAPPPLAELAVADAAPVLAMNAFVPVSEVVPVAPISAPIDWLTSLVVLWLAGAAIFLARRFALYFAMRRALLEAAKPVGEVGRVRLVETTATLGPVAFGVFDKVVALPVGFMAQRDRRRRDLAIAHELAHHRGHDLLANVLVQPLFAVHWFNPLGWVGWTALRRDQEAACDARVVTARSRDERAAYAAIIAGFATAAGAAPRLALAAPMACPVLGDKSIIHRLRSLTLADISPRRRFAGRALLAGAALALPLTASISYAETGAPLAPPAPLTPVAPPVPVAPEAPALPPLPPAPPEIFDRLIQRNGEGELGTVDPEAEVEGAARGIRSHTVRIERRLDGEARADGERPVRHRVFRLFDPGLTPEARAQMEADLAEMRKKLAEDGALGQEIARARIAAPEIIHSCQDGQTEPIASGKTGSGREALFYCRSVAMDRAASLAARTAMRSARAAIENARRVVQADRSLSETQRSEALRSIEEALSGLPAEG